MATGDLATLDVVKQFLAVTTTASDAVIARQIRQITQEIFNYLQRSTHLSRTYTDVLDGHAGRAAFLQQWPVTSITSVSIDGEVVPVSTDQGVGYLLQAWDGYPPGIVQSVDLIGYAFCYGRQNVQIAYRAGYLISDEAQTIPATTPFTITVDQPQGPWAQDEGVTFSDGTALVKVTGTPAAGQYALSTEDGDGPGTYIFAEADASLAVLISYSYAPSALEDACINWASERYKRRDRIGQKSKSLGGQETISFDNSGMPDYIKTALQPFRKVLPI